MSTGVAYDPERVRELARRATAVVEHLAAVPFVADPLALGAVSVAAAVREHMESGWLAALARVEASTALLAPMDSGGPPPVPGASQVSSGVIASVVAGFSPQELAYFQGFVDASATTVAMELSRYDEHPDYAIDRLPAELESLDSGNDWGWLAKLYLIEQYHGMVDRGEVTLRRDGDEYWIDPYDLMDVKSVASSDVVLAAVVASGSFHPGVGLSEASAKTVTSKMPEPRPIEEPVAVVVRPEGAPTKIAGFTRHGEEQMRGRDGGRVVARWAVDDAVANPTHVIDHGDGSYKYLGESATVVLNDRAYVITCYSRTRKAWAPR